MESKLETTVFPLSAKAEQAGIFKLETGFLISAPTATGKSRIGREVIARFLSNRGPQEYALYLVPFKALAEEIFSDLWTELKGKLDTPDRLQIKTGDYENDFDVKETHVVVATYESAETILKKGENLIWPKIIIADELTVMADHSRGVRIEGLLSHFARLEGVKIYGLSAVLKDPEEVRKWLGSSNETLLLQGDKKDRPSKLEILPYTFENKGKTIESLVHESLRLGNVLIFCETKSDTRIVARSLEALVNKSMDSTERTKAKELGRSLRGRFQYLTDLPDMVSNGVAFHNADLENDLRIQLSKGFDQKIIKVICATTTLSAGINLPARTVILRDIYRAGKLIPVSEAINMLGRAGRPKKDKAGTAYYLLPKDYKIKSWLLNFSENISKNQVENLVSQIPSSLTNIMVFILGSVARSGEITREVLIEMFRHTYWVSSAHIELPSTIPRDIDLNQFGPSFKQVDANVEPKNCSVSDGNLIATGGGNGYEIKISAEEAHCKCPGFKFYGNCKHVKYLAFLALTGKLDSRIPAARNIVMRNFDLMQLNPAFKIALAVKRLLTYAFLVENFDDETNVSKLRITRDGEQALVNFLLSMNHVVKLRDRIKSVKSNPKNTDTVIGWAIDDLLVSDDELQEEKSVQSECETFINSNDSFGRYLEGISYKSAFKESDIRPFFNCLNRLDQIFNAYLAFCPVENKDLALLIRNARRRVHYGCEERFLPLMVLEIDELSDPEVAKKLYDSGVTNIRDLSKCDPSKIEKYLKVDNQTAQRIHERINKIIPLIESLPLDKQGLLLLSQKTGITPYDLTDYLLQMAS